MKKVADFIDRHELIASSEKVLVGFSGGADSVVLLHLLSELGYTCEAAHVNFRLRGKVSDEDARFCRNFCEQLHIPFYYLEEDTKAYAKKHKLSVEMAAREIRYNWFNKLLETYQLDAIAVAHHKNDQAETILMNLIRGTGITGMRGMLPKNGKIIRPLLCMTRKEVEDYVSIHKLQFRTDATNADTTIRRNLIRHEILPRIEKLNPAFTESVDDLSQRFAESGIIVEEYIRKWKGKNMVDQDRIPIEKLFQSPASLTILYGILSEFGFGASAIQDIYNAWPYQSGSRFLGGAYYILADRDYLLIEPVKQQEQEVGAREVYPENKLDSNLHFEELSINELESIPKEAHIACLDMDQLTLPLRIRPWRQGDKFRPLGMKGFKKVSDFLIDNKINLAEKESVNVLLSGDNIIWVIGYRIDDRFKTTKNTQFILWIEHLVE
ncbi:tRNA lysidine(34) synthetase TilS [Saccharicrinis sp. FJH62]|uniref:tRNA lysidine(34) synthetase TilS n=1 Tax=Saccharicrinis sp. FJH62 TaxID=3344657 RepID=UPI0035D4A976